MTFKETCNKFNIPTKQIKFDVTVEVYKEIKQMAANNDRSLPDFMRDLTDYIIINEVN
jgi:hypothetical protein